MSQKSNAKITKVGGKSILVIYESHWIIYSIILSIIIFFFTSWLTLRSQYKPTFNWWDNNSGSKYNKFFNIFTMTAYKSSNLWYTISNFSNPPSIQYNNSQYEFIIEHLLRYSRYTEDGVQCGILTPQSLCRTLLFSPDDSSPDIRFLNWFNAGPSRGNHITGVRDNGLTGKIVSGIDINKPLTYTQIEYPTNLKGDAEPPIIYFYELHITSANTNNEVNIYPDKMDRQGWSGLMLEWLNGTSGLYINNDTTGNPNVQWCYQPDKNGLMSITLNPFVKNSPDPYVYWNMTTESSNKKKKFKNGQADNFMSRFGIHTDSPLFTFFINNTYEYAGQTIDTDSYHQLIGGTGGSTGGWLGFLQEHNHWEKEDFIHMISSEVAFEAPTNPNPCSPGDPLGGVLAGITAFVGVFAIAFAGETGPGGIMGFMEAKKALIGIASLSAVANGLNSGRAKC